MSQSSFLATSRRSSWSVTFAPGTVHGMIFAEARDGLTRAIVTRAAAPGMDRLVWVETNTEEDIRTDLSAEMNAAMRAGAPDLTIAPWPLPVPAQAPVDYTMRYDGLLVRLHAYDQVHEAWAPVPGGVAVIDQNGDALDRDHQNLSHELNPAEVRETAADPTKWIRLPFDNEVGGTVLKEPLWMRWQSLQNARFTIELPDNDLFTPTDLTKISDRYRVLNDEGKLLDHGEGWAEFGTRARLVFYLRPRRWKWIVVLFCLFEYEDWWGSAPSYETFVSTFWRRPPFHPYRHNLAVTAQPEHYNLINWNGELRTYDYGIESAWDLSWHSRELRLQVLMQQFFSLCEAYVFLSNEPPDIAIQAFPPRPGEIVMGIGHVDEVTGRESRVWIQVATDLSAVYPQRTVGQFLAYWDV